MYGNHDDLDALKRTSRPLEMPMAAWESTNAALEKRLAAAASAAVVPKGSQASKNNNKNETKNNSNKGIWMRHFTYILKDEAFCQWGIQNVSNLFFEHAVAVKEDISKEYFIVHMNDQDAEDEQAGNVTKDFFSFDVDPLRESILRNGILVAEYCTDSEVGDAKKQLSLYSLIGCSNSQVQKHCYIFRRGSLQENETRLCQVLPGLQELERKKGIPKRVKYAGLLFSGITAIDLPDNVIVEEIESKKSSNANFDFTDGPGLISLKLAMLVKEKLGIAGRDSCPSVFQIRYCGIVSLANGKREGKVCKGVLLVDPENTDTYKIQVRQSMLKISSSEEACHFLQQKLGICDYSKPSPGRLGQQQICLLSGVVHRTDFIQLQKEHLDCVATGLQDPFAMAWLLALDRRPYIWSHFHKVLLHNHDGNDDSKRRSLYEKCASVLEKDRLGTASLRKVQLPLAASRTLFGAVFPELLHDILQEGECVVLLEDGPLCLQNNTSNSCGLGDDTYVIVSRSPSYYPGDIRALRVVNLPDGHPCRTLRNCILFATKGERPEPDKMGGGDLDGDKYLVIWHPVLLKYAASLRETPAANYDAPTTNTDSSTTSSKGDWIQYAALTDNSMLGEVESTFYKLAKHYGVDSPELKKLNSLFASLVDRIPTSLEVFRQLKNSVAGVSGSGHSVWEEMTVLQREIATERQHRIVSYQKFQNKAEQYAMDPHLFGRKTTEDFGYHFLDSIRKTDLLLTVEAMRKRRPDAEVSGSLAARASESSTAIQTLVTGPFKITSAEAKSISEIENRARNLFREPLADIADRFQKESVMFNKLKSGKEAACRRKDEALRSIERQILELDEEKSTALESFRVSRDDVIALRVNLRQQKQAAHFQAAETLRDKLKQHTKSLLELNRNLDQVNKELGHFGFVWAFVSESARNASAQKQHIESMIEYLKKECELLETEIRLETTGLHDDLITLDINSRTEVARLQQVHEQTLRELNAQRSDLETQMVACSENFDALISGATKARMEACAQETRKQLKVLRKQLDDCLRNSHPVCDVSELKTKIRSLKNKLTVTEDASRELFCPRSFREAREAITDLKEEEGSLQIGLEHILYKSKQAKQQWKRRLESEIGTFPRRKEEWKAVLGGLERIFSIEENRLLGFPRGGERKGPLRVYHRRSLLRKHLCTSQAIIVTAGTGCGKSTQLPQYIADDFYLYRCPEIGAKSDDVEVDDGEAPVRVCCTQPRRVAAQGVAKRVAEEYKTNLGDLVGFRVGSRGRSREECVQVSDNTVIEFVTEGLLLYNLARSKEFIKRYDCVIIDEMHERNTEQDLCLSLLREYLKDCKSTRPSFKVVVMSASIDASRFCAYFDDCPAMDCPGINLPVKQIYMPPPDETGEALSSHIVDVLFDQIVDGAKGTPGDVLIFLSGAKEIEACVSSIQSRASETDANVVTYPLFAKLDRDSISAATNPDHRFGLRGELSALKKKNGKKPTPKDDIRKIICCTNIAETSLTIDRVRFVIDTGLAKKVSYNHSIRCVVLNEGWVSWASTIQRKGRAGRTDCGWCYHLYSESFHNSGMKEYDTPKILDESVDQLILFSLDVCKSKRSIEHMGLLDSPSDHDIKNAKERLLDLDFIQPGEQEGEISLTRSGQVACALKQVLPESVRMMLNACKRYPHCIKRAINLAVLMSSSESIFDDRLKVHEEESSSHVYGDHLLSLQHLEWFEEAHKRVKKGNTKSLKKKCLERGLNLRVLNATLEDVEKCHQELKKRKLLGGPGKGVETGGQEQCLLRLLISGYFHHLTECLDPELVSRIGCALLTNPELTFFLDRDSCLRGSLTKSHRQCGSVDEEEGEMNQSETGESSGSDSFAVTKDEVDPSFLLYGQLFCPATNQTIFMRDASIVEGQWIEDEAPERWLARVQFDASRKNLCRITIKHVGPSILSECATPENFEEIQRASGVKALVSSPQHSLVKIVGDQSTVESAKCAIQEKMLSVIEKRRRSDQSFNDMTRLRYSSGMNVENVLKHGDGMNTTLDGLFRSFGIVGRERDQISHMATVFVDQKRSILFLRPIRDCASSDVKKLCKDVPASWNVATSKNGEIQLKLKSNRARGSGGSNTNISSFDLSNKADAVVAIIKDIARVGAATVGVQSFTGKIAVSTATAIGHEATIASAFWQSLCSQGYGTMSSFVQSHDLFTFGLDSKKAKNFKDVVNKLSKTMQNFEITHSSTFSRQQTRFFASGLAEVKKCCPTVLFYLVEVKTVGDHPAAKFDFSQSEYEWLMKIAKTKAITSIRLNFSALKANDKEQARKLLHQKLSNKALEEQHSPASFHELSTPGKSEWKECVMCRRSIRVRFGKKSTSKEVHVSDDVIEGWNLTLCGCSYCRECFLNAVVESLSDPILHSARCLLCKRDILAKDCFAIIAGPGRREGISKLKKDVYKSEWNQVCRLAEANYCEANVTQLTQHDQRPSRKFGRIDRSKGWATCPDCSVSMVFPAGYNFFLCRNPNCRSKMCTRCYQVMTSEEDSSRCAANECCPHDENC